MLANARVLLIHPRHVYNTRMGSESDKSKWWANRWARMLFLAGCLLGGLVLFVPLLVVVAIREGDDPWHLITQGQPVWSLFKLAVAFVLLWGPFELAVNARRAPP